MDRKPFAYVMKSGQVVLEETLEQYAIKTTDSRRIDTAPFEYLADGLREPRYNPNRLSNLLEMNTYHAACVDTKASDIGRQGIQIKAITEDADDDNKNRIETFLKRCVPLPEEVFYRMAYDKQAVGYGCLELIRQGHLHDSEPERLEHIPSHTIRVHNNGNKYRHSWDGLRKVWFKRIGYEKDIHKVHGTEHALGSLKPNERASELIFDVSYSTQSIYYGMADIVPAFKTVIGDASAVDYNIYFFKNFGVPDYAVFIMGDFVDERIRDAAGNLTDRTVVQNMIEDQMRSVIRNPHSTMVVSLPTPPNTVGGKVEVKFEKLTVDIKDSSFRLYRQANRDEIISAHRVDPYRIGIVHTGTLGGNIAKEAKENYKKMVVLPNQRILEALINNYVIHAENGMNIQDWKIEFARIDTTDEEHEMKLCSNAFKMGSMTPNQIIRKWKDRLGLGEVDTPAMNTHYIYPVGQPVYAIQETVPKYSNKSEDISALIQLRDAFLKKAEELENEK